MPPCRTHAAAVTADADVGLADEEHCVASYERGVGQGVLVDEIHRNVTVHRQGEIEPELVRLVRDHILLLILPLGCARWVPNLRAVMSENSHRVI